MDGEGPDDELDIPNGLILKKNYIGKKTKDYDSFLVVAHFKGHGWGGFGGALKQLLYSLLFSYFHYLWIFPKTQGYYTTFLNYSNKFNRINIYIRENILSIGFGSRVSKTIQHSAGTNADPDKVFDHFCSDKDFKECMADCASSFVNKYKGKLCYINVMKNISCDCDCDGKARPPCMKDIGILASTDPVAIDQACLDLIYNSEDPGKKELIERIEGKLGPHIIECAVKLGVGSTQYELINVD